METFLLLLFASLPLDDGDTASPDVDAACACAGADIIYIGTFNFLAVSYFTIIGLY